MSFAEGLKRERLKRKLTQVKLAKISGVPQATISAIELGDRSPTEETMVLLAKGLRCSVSDIIGDSDKKSPADENGEAMNEELISLLTSLSPEEAQRVRDFVSGLLASQSK